MKKFFQIIILLPFIIKESVACQRLFDNDLSINTWRCGLTNNIYGKYSKREEQDLKGEYFEILLSSVRNSF